MRKLSLVLLLVFVYLSPLSSQISQEDSLLNLLHAHPDTRQQIDLLIQLADKANTPDKEYLYGTLLYKEAKKQQDKFGLAVSLGVLASHFIEKLDKDSLNSCLEGADLLLKESDYDGLTTYYRMAFKARLIQTAERDKRAAICERIMGELEMHKNMETQFEEVERLFLCGIITYQLMALSERTDWSKGLPYWEKAWQLIQHFPLTAKRSFSANLCVCLISTYNMTKKHRELETIADTYLKTLDEFYEQEEIRKRRPFMDKDFSYLICYQQLILSVGVVGKEKSEQYYRQYCEFMKGNGGDNLLRNKTFFYDTSCKYFLFLKDYAKALAYKDSLIKLIEKGQSLTSASTLHYKDKARILSGWGKYEEACNVYEEALALQDSLIEKEYIGKVGEMRVKYELDKLELANANLLAVKRKAALNFTIYLLGLIFIIAGYLYWNLKKMKSLQKELVKQNAKARESENMKTAFINSMCHEIRTPLNVITGFAEVVAGEGLETQEKAQYVEIIRKNTKDLTSLLDDLLEAANLDSSTDEFVKEPIDIITLCKKEMSSLQDTEGKKTIRYKLDLPQSKCIVYTHARYFSLLLRALLNNANKFTQQGEITLSCRIDEESSQAVFSVADTGCGIPEDKRKYIFERFVKLDAFSQGNGMGLYICSGILARMKGEIRVDPDYVNGAKLIFTLPL